MKFTVLSHAGLAVEHQGTTVLLDPWLIGSCYWRSWWNLPEPPEELVSTIRPDFIYLTHLHWDHFHGVSLKRFDPATCIVVPKVCSHRMVNDLRWLGFSNINEIPHGESLQLDNDFVLHSFQFGMGVDSCVVLQAGGITLLNANDCKYFGYPLRNLLSKFPNVDFVFRSHSSASAIPYCIDGYKARFPALRTAGDYEEEFARFAIYCGAKYAVPFASNHCFLHKETQHFNATAVTPMAAAERCNDLALRCGVRTRGVIMSPGSSWDQTEGFCIKEFDYRNRDAYVTGLLEKYGPRLEDQYAFENEAIADRDSFSRYFSQLIQAIPRAIRSRWQHSISFRVERAGARRYWVIDFMSGSVTFETEPPREAIIIETAPNILNDCTQKNMFSVWTASKRLRIFLESEAQRKDLSRFFAALDAFELDLLPIWKNFRLRSLGVYTRRWREILEALSVAVSVKILKRPFVYRDVYPLPQGASEK